MLDIWHGSDTYILFLFFEGKKAESNIGRFCNKFLAAQFSKSALSNTAV